MIAAIILDSTPLGLLSHRRGFPAAEGCRAWLESKVDGGARVFAPAIVVYELRRELLRLGLRGSIERLDRFIAAESDRYLHLTDVDLNLAADLWARARRQGRPTADPHALDIDVILAAQALSLRLPPDEFVIATENVGHLAQFVPAKPWREC